MKTFISLGLVFGGIFVSDIVANASDDLFEAASKSASGSIENGGAGKSLDSFATSCQHMGDTSNTPNAVNIKNQPHELPSNPRLKTDALANNPILTRRLFSQQTSNSKINENDIKKQAISATIGCNPANKFSLDEAFDLSKKMNTQVDKNHLIEIFSDIDRETWQLLIDYSKKKTSIFDSSDNIDERLPQVWTQTGAHFHAAFATTTAKYFPKDDIGKHRQTQFEQVSDFFKSLLSVFDIACGHNLNTKERTPKNGNAFLSQTLIDYDVYTQKHQSLTSKTKILEDYNLPKTNLVYQLALTKSGKNGIPIITDQDSLILQDGYLKDGKRLNGKIDKKYKSDRVYKMTQVSAILPVINTMYVYSLVYLGAEYQTTASLLGVGSVLRKKDETSARNTLESELQKHQGYKVSCRSFVQAIDSFYEAFYKKCIQDIIASNKLLNNVKDGKEYYGKCIVDKLQESFEFIHDKYVLKKDKK